MVNGHTCGRQDDQDSVDRERAEEEERQSHQQQSSSALDVLGSMLPFGHPNLGARRLMAIDSSGGHRTSNHGGATSKHGKTGNLPSLQHNLLLEIYQALLW